MDTQDRRPERRRRATRRQQRPVPTRAIPITIGGIGPRTLALVREHADWWNVPVHQLDRIPELRERAGDARVSVQVRVALARDDAERAEIVATDRRRFGETIMHTSLIVGTAGEVADRLAALHDQGIDRTYLWFADFAPVDTLARVGEVVTLLR